MEDPTGKRKDDLCKESERMTFEIGKSYYDTVGRRWKIVKWRIVGDGYAVFIVKRRFKTEIAV